MKNRALTLALAACIVTGPLMATSALAQGGPPQMQCEKGKNCPPGGQKPGQQPGQRMDDQRGPGKSGDHRPDQLPGKGNARADERRDARGPDPRNGDHRPEMGRPGDQRPGQGNDQGRPNMPRPGDMQHADRNGPGNGPARNDGPGGKINHADHRLGEKEMAHLPKPGKNEHYAVADGKVVKLNGKGKVMQVLGPVDSVLR